LQVATLHKKRKLIPFRNFSYESLNNQGHD